MNHKEEKPTYQAVAQAIEEAAPLFLQEEWDNSGWQIKPLPRDGDQPQSCMLCLDVTDEVIDQAIEKGCPFIISHHPLIFKGIRRFDGTTRTDRIVARLLRHGIAVYSSHTALDSAPRVGVSWRLARMLGLQNIRPLLPNAADPDAGLGAVGDLPTPVTADEFVELVKHIYGQPTVTTSMPLVDKDLQIHRVALCGGAGNEFYCDAVAAGAQAYVTSDIKYHHFVDFGADQLLVQVGHHESEICTKNILADIISKKFPNFAVHIAHETLPVSYQ